ncbi:MAG: protoheme IX farnesyltransferase, partial [Candidatus Paceibacteria bacterium]
MSVTQTQTLPTSWVKNFTEITKLRLSVSVVFSSVAGYLLGATQVDFMVLLLLCIGGYCMVGASNVYNQIMERDLDILMDRTKNRPIPVGSISVSAALSLAIVLTLVGLLVLYSINPQTAMFGAISIFIYVFLYTPLKTKTPLSVFVGAFPGAIPFMLGWVAATNDFGIEPGTLFMIQFFWQFPHFWAIGWFLFEDYKKGGFFMLPTGKRDRATAIQVILYSICTVLASLIPAFGVTGSFYITPISAVIIGALGVWFIYYAIRLYKQKTDKSAKQLM